MLAWFSSVSVNAIFCVFFTAHRRGESECRQLRVQICFHYYWQTRQPRALLCFVDSDQQLDPYQFIFIVNAVRFQLHILPYFERLIVMIISYYIDNVISSFLSTNLLFSRQCMLCTKHLSRVQYEHKLCSLNINVQLNIVSFQCEYEFVYLIFVQDVACSKFFSRLLVTASHTCQRLHRFANYKRFSMMSSEQEGDLSNGFF